MDNSWIYFSLLTLFFWGVAQVLLKKGFSNISSLWSIAISASINTLIYVPFALYTGATFSISPISFVYILTITVLNMLFFYAIAKGQLSFTGTILVTYPVTTILLSYFFLGNSPTRLQYLMIALILFGGGLLGYSSQDNKKKKTLRSSWLIWAIVGAVGIGIADFMAKITIEEIGVETYNLFFPLAYILGFLGYWFFDRRGRVLPKKVSLNQFSWTIGGVLLLTVGMLSFNYALDHGNVALVTTISSGYAALTVVLAHFFLREKINMRQLLAVACVLIGIIFIGI